MDGGQSPDNVVNMGEAKRAPSWVCHWCVPKIDGSSFSFIFPLQNTFFAFFWGGFIHFWTNPSHIVGIVCIYIYTTIYIYTYCRSYNMTITSHCITRYIYIYIYIRVYIYMYVSICIHIYIYITYIILLYFFVYFLKRKQSLCIILRHEFPI